VPLKLPTFCGPCSYGAGVHFSDERQAAAVSELIGHDLEEGHEFSAQ